MGLMARWTYHDGRWRDGEHRRAPYLVVDVHDSDIAIVEFAPAADEHDWLCLGYEPRDYFERPDMHPPLDRERAARGFATWVREVTGGEVDAAEVRALLAVRSDEPPLDDFAEETLLRLLALAGLPVPPELDDYVVE